MNYKPWTRFLTVITDYKHDKHDIDYKPWSRFQNSSRHNFKIEGMDYKLWARIINRATD